MDISKYARSATDSEGGKKKSYITYAQLADDDVAGASEKQKMLNDGYNIVRQLRAQNVDVERLVFEELLVPVLDQLNNKGK